MRAQTFTRRGAIAGSLAATGLPAFAQPGDAAAFAASADPRRTDADRAADERRRPAQTLAFAGLAPGQHVVELLPGQGYFTRLLAAAVGKTGKLTLIPWGEPNTGGSRRMAADPAFGNIEVFPENLLAYRPSPPADLIFTVQNYHDFVTPQRAQINQVLFRALKPGGKLVVLDHAAKDGSGYAGIPLHRIDEALVRKELAAAGFRFEADSQALRNPADDRTLNVFNPVIRGKTDQFMLRFVRP